MRCYAGGCQDLRARSPPSPGSLVLPSDPSDRPHQRQQSDARRMRKAVGQEPSVRLFGDVAYEGGLYSPQVHPLLPPAPTSTRRQRGKAYMNNGDEGIEEEIEVREARGTERVGGETRRVGGQGRSLTEVTAGVRACGSFKVLAQRGD